MDPSTLAAGSVVAAEQRLASTEDSAAQLQRRGRLRSEEHALARAHFARRLRRIQTEESELASQLQGEAAAARLETWSLEGVLAEEGEALAARQPCCLEHEAAAAAALRAALHGEGAEVHSLRLRLAELETPSSPTSASPGSQQRGGGAVASSSWHTQLRGSEEQVQKAVDDLKLLYAKMSYRYVELESAAPPPALAQQLQALQVRLAGQREDAQELAGEMAELRRREQNLEDTELRLLAAARAGDWTLRSLHAELAASERRGVELASTLAVERERARVARPMGQLQGGQAAIGSAAWR